MVVLSLLWTFFYLSLLFLTFTRVQSSVKIHPVSHNHHNSLIPGVNVPIHAQKSMSTLTGTNPGKLHLPLCKENEYAEGKWVKNKEIVHKDFICCTWDGDQYLLNTTLCGNLGIISRSMGYGSIYHYSLVGGNGCACEDTTTLLTPREEYLWEPDNCRLLPWNGKQFCALLGYRKIALVGDSTAQQLFSTLASMIYAHGGGCSSNIQFFSSNLLIEFGGMQSIDEIVFRVEPDIVIIGAGAWFHSVPELPVPYVRSHLLPVMHRYPKMKVIVRGSHPGHTYCGNYTSPIEELFSEMEGDKYDWNLHPAFDLEWKKLADEGSFVYLNTTPLYYRPDSHPGKWNDCLHYCLPGPLNYESNVLLTQLFTGEL